MDSTGQTEGATRQRPPVIMIESPALPSRLTLLARHLVPLMLPAEAVTGTVLERLRPPAVAMALFCPVNDASRMLSRLERVGYRGRIALLSPPLPKPRMVERELRKQFPALRIWVVELPDLPFA
jgi:hypothetical protein